MVEELVREFVPEALAAGLDFSGLQRVNPKFHIGRRSARRREGDVSGAAVSPRAARFDRRARGVGQRSGRLAPSAPGLRRPAATVHWVDFGPVQFHKPEFG